MANINTTARPRATIQPATNPLISNVTCTLSNTEYSHAVSPLTKKLQIRCRGKAVTKLAFESGDSGTLFFTIPMGCTFTEDDIEFSGSVYFQTNKANQVIEIVEWY